jgi:hypothetical protein
MQHAPAGALLATDRAGNCDREMLNIRQ